MALPKNLGPGALAQLAAAGFKTKVNKYHRSAPDQRMADGRVFDSKLERDAYLVLKDTFGQTGFELQREFTLLDPFAFNGKKYRAIKYRCDFVVTQGMEEHIIDMKGMETPAFKDREKMFVSKYRKPLLKFKTVSQLKLWLAETFSQ